MLNIPQEASYEISPKQRAYLDFLRAFAASIVMLEHGMEIFHLKSVTYLGITGVTIFFLSSGFLISVAAFRRLYQPGRQFWPFMIDRTARIYTPYVPALALAVLANLLFPVGKWGQEGANTGLVVIGANLMMLQDYPVFQVLARLLRDDALRIHAYNTAEQFWTVAIEYWIYLAFALAFFVGVRKERTARGALLVSLLFVVPVVLYSAFANAGQCLSLVWAIGAMFGYVFVVSSRTSNYGVKRYFVLVAVGIVGLAGRLLKTGELSYELQAIVFMAMILFGIFMILGSDRTDWRYVSPVAAFVAKYSYSLYLVHNTIFIVIYTQLADRNPLPWLILSFTIAHLVAYAFYVLFERHHYEVGAWMRRLILRRPARQPAPFYPAALPHSPG